MTFAEQLQQSLAIHSERLAVEGRDRRLTYAELDATSASLADALCAAGIAAGNIIPLRIRRSVALVVAEVAVLRLGAAYAPIDLTSPPARQQAMLDQLITNIVLTDGSSVQSDSAAQGFDVESFVNEQLKKCTIDTKCPKGNSRPWDVAPPNAAAYVMFTSGTTGVPKGVLVPHSGIKRLVTDTNFADFTADSRWGFISSPAFDLSTLEVWAPLLNGGCCVVQEIAQPSLDDLAAFLIAQGITDTWLTSSLFSAMVDDRPDAFAGIRQLLAGGERVSPRHARRLLELYPDLRLINGYGPTENTTFTLCHDIAPADCDNALGIPIGRPIHGTSVRIDTNARAKVEGDEGELLGNEGELLAGGEGVALGYLNDETLTASKFVRIDGHTWYRTGDMVRRRDDGVFEFLGRTDRQIKLQGNRVELDEVERVLAACPGVSNCRVLVRGTTVENRHLVAVYSGIGIPPAAEFVSEFLHQYLAAAAIPARLVPVAHIPLSTTGKIDGAALAALIDGGPDIPDASNVERAASSNGTHARAVSSDIPEATSATEQQLLEIWRHYLPDVSIDRGTSFLSAGGTSILASQVSAQVRRKLGKNLTPIDVLRVPVLSEQAQVIDAAPVFEEPDHDRLAAEFEMPLTEVQRSMLLGTQLDESGAAYLVHVALQFEKSGADARETVLRRAFAQLAARHPALRMSVVEGSNSPVARVRPTLGNSWWNEYAETINDAPADLRWPANIMATVNRPLNLARDGVMRVDVWTVADGSMLVVWTMHHIAVDEASIDRALIELDHLLSGTSLQPVYGSPLGFATFEKAWTDRDAVRDWPPRFVSALSDCPTVVPRAPARGDEVPVDISPALSSHLQATCARWGVTPFTPLLAAYGRALQAVFGVENRFAMTPISRRVDAELVDPIGCLLDITPVEAGARPGEAPNETLDRVHETILGLHRTKFFPGRAVAEAIAQLNPRVTEHLNAFAFTWRIDPSRTVTLGSRSARLLRIPQQGARFGLTLHTWLDGQTLRCSVEAVSDYFNNGRVAALAQAFSRQLELLCNSSWTPSYTASTATDDQALATPESGRKGESLRRAWSHWLKVPEETITDASNFLHSGGNSLTAMRMMSQIQRQLGLRIGTGEFLAQPTFYNLRTLGVEPRATSPKYSVVVGALDAANIVIMFPGNGPTIEVYSLAVEAQRTLGTEHAVVIVDLELMLEYAPDNKLVDFVRDRTAKLLNEIGAGRIVAFVGYSNGGLLALEFARSFTGGISPQVWLLDTYAPISPMHRFTRDTLQTMENTARRMASPVVRPFLRSKMIATALGTHVRTGRRPRPAVQEVPAEILTPMQRRHHVYNDVLSSRWEERGGGEVHLVQARQSVTDENLVWRRNTNGFERSRYAVWYDHKLDATHGGVVRAHLAEVALIISSGLRASRGRTRSDND